MRVTSRVLVWSLSATMAWAQASAPQNQPEVVSHEAPATFSSRVNLVSVPVVVRDRDGHPIGSLRQEDFQLFDKGRSQVITKFSVEASTGLAGTSVAAPVEIQAPGTQATAKEKPALPQRYVAYLFDDVHTKPADLLNGRVAAKRQIDRAFDPAAGDSMSRAAIFTTSGQTTQDFTADIAKLHGALDRIHPWSPATDKNESCPYVSFYLADLLINQTHSLSPGLSDAQVIAMMASDQALAAVIAEAEVCMHTTRIEIVLPAVRNAAQTSLNYGLEETKVSLNMLRDLVQSMSALPGNRTIVLASPGFLLASDQRFYENDLFDKAIHASVTINTLDIRGVATPSGFEASDKGYQSAASGRLLQYENTAASQAQDILAETAAGTGGRFFHNDNGLEEGLKELAARPEYVYVLGFSPDNLKFDGSFHGLKVTLKNGAGASLKVEARRGYWAPNHAIDPAEQAKEEIRDAVFSREEMLDIPVKLHTEFFKQSDLKAQLTIETRVDVKGIKFKKTDDRNRDTVTVVTGLFDENGRYVKGMERTMEMRLRDQTLDSARNAGMIVKENFDVSPGRYIVRVVVRDAEGQSMAAQNEGVEIP